MKEAAELGFHVIRLDDLVRFTQAEVDALPFGVVGLSPGGIVEVYNQTESRQAGIDAQSVVGTNFFLSTAQCMNNYLVAQRLEDEPELNTVLDYVLTFRMRPTPVQLRLLKSAGQQRSYILIQR